MPRKRKQVLTELVFAQMRGYGEQRILWSTPEVELLLQDGTLGVSPTKWGKKSPNFRFVITKSGRVVKKGLALGLEAKSENELQKMRREIIELGKDFFESGLGLVGN